MKYYTDQKGRRRTVNIPEYAWEEAKEGFPRNSQGIRVVDRTDPNTFAQAAAQHVWLHDADDEVVWPLTLTVVDDKGDEHEFVVAIDSVKRFSVLPSVIDCCAPARRDEPTCKLMQGGVVLLHGEEAAIREIHGHLIGKQLKPEEHQNYLRSMREQNGWGKKWVPDNLSVVKVR